MEKIKRRDKDKEREKEKVSKTADKIPENPRERNIPKLNISMNESKNISSEAEEKDHLINYYK